MPKIPGFGPTTISTRVPGTNLSSAGTGAVARELANFGAQGAQIATQLLNERKEFQANTYANESRQIMARERQDFFQRKTKEMDPATGKMPDGRYLNDHVEEFETTRLEELGQLAPTELARNRFMERSAPDQKRSLIEADQYQYRTIVDTDISRTVRLNEDRAKEIRSYDDTGSTVTITNYVNNMLKIMGQENSDKVGKILDTEGVVKLNKATGNTISRQSLENMLEKGYVGEGLRNLRHTLVNSPEHREKLKKAVESSTKKALGELVQLNDGSVAFQVLSPGGEQVGEYYDVETGQLVKQEAAGVTGFDMGAINVGAEVPESAVEKYLTPEQKDNFIDRFAELSKQKRKENLAELGRRQNDLTAAFESTQDGIKMRRVNPDHKDALLAHVEQLQNNVEDPSQLNRELIDLSTSVTLGESFDRLSSVTLNPEEAESLLKGIPFKTESVARELFGADSEIINQPGFMAALQNQASAKAQSAYAAVRRQQLSDSAGYAVANDPKLRKLAQNMGTNGGYRAYKELLKKRQEDMAIPLAAAKTLPDSMMIDLAGKYQNYLAIPGTEGLSQTANFLLQQKRVFGEDYSTIMGDLQKFGADPELAYAATLMPDTLEGNQTSQLIIKNFREKPQDAIAPAVFNKIKDEAWSQLSNFDSAVKLMHNFGEDTKIMQAIVPIVSKEASRLLVQEGSDITDEAARADAVKRASQAMVMKHYELIQSGATNIVVEKAKLSANKITKEDIKTTTRFIDRGALEGQIDVGKSIPGLEAAVDPRLDPEQRERVYKILLDQTIPVNPVVGDNIVPSRQWNGTIYPLLDKKGKQIEIPLKDVPAYNKSQEGKYQERLLNRGNALDLIENRNVGIPGL